MVCTAVCTPAKIPSDPLPGTWAHDSGAFATTNNKWRRFVSFLAPISRCSTPSTAMFTKPSSLHLKLSYICALSLLVLILVATSPTSPEFPRREALRPPRLDLKAHDAIRPSRRLDFVADEYFFEARRLVRIGLVNVEDEKDVLEWDEVGETKKVRFDKVPSEVSWNAFFPEWIDEDEKRRPPACPEIPMPGFEEYEGLDAVVVRVPAGGRSRDVARLQVNLVAANLAVRSGRRVNGSVLTVFVGPGEPMLEIFRCDDLVTRVGDLRVYRPDLGRLEQKLALPLGSCQLSLPLIKHGQGRIDYDFAKMKSPLHQPREAYVTLLHSSEAYVCGAIALARSIIQTNSTKDLLLLADDSITGKSLRALSSAGWKIRRIDRIRSPFAKRKAYNEWNYSKLRIWQLTDYDKVIFVDADFLVLENLDGFFASPELSAAGNDKFIFNSGIMLVEPSECVFERLMEDKERLVSYNGGDQGYLNEVFVWWHRWPNRLNWLKIFMSENSSREVPPQAYAVHYLGAKPWMCYRDYDCNWDEKAHQFLDTCVFVLFLGSQVLFMMDATTETSHRPFSIKLWPPSMSTRLMLLKRMTKNLSSPSMFSRKYGLLSKEEAEENAKEIEETAFSSANEHFEKEPDGDGSSAVQLYAKESSKLMLEVLKRGPRQEDKEDLLSNGGPVTTLFDISGGKRAFIEADEAQDLLKPLTVQGNSYTKICFSNRSFGIGAARVAEPILASIKDKLTDVDLSDFIAGRPEAEALEVMSIFADALQGSVLRSLNLSNNALGEKGVRAFGELLKSQTRLEELYLMNDGISEEAARAVCELIPSTENLRILHFHNNMTGDEGAIAISEVVKRSPSLEDFRCSSTRVDSDGGVALAEALEVSSNLRKLDLRDNMFGVDAGKALSKTISCFKGLTEVYLSYLNLEDEGTIALANALKNSAPSLEVLEMAGNDITAEAAPALAECIAEKQSLSKLNLSENELKDEGAIKIAEGLEEGHEQLKEVDMSTNSLRRAGTRKLARAVLSKPHFVLLNINGNFISDEGIEEVKEILKAGEKGLDVLGPLDENDPEGEEGEEEEEEEEKSEEEEGKEEEKELESKLGGLKVDE
ncbi:hypothetical protein H6P81_002434 [Aristolochia fimbriata]|uniref:WPP domain-containing protein n=1 Tax=Aristolochia fimbriata TaxID=158543 RepID=A0AAV7FAX5_ARIFI|nr:hypothetical protein H6P81_002434 [Aristolochia fimbriata]